MSSSALDLEGLNFVFCVVEQSIPEGRDSFLIGAVPGLLPVQVRDCVQGLAHDGSARDICGMGRSRRSGSRASPQVTDASRAEP